MNDQDTIRRRRIFFALSILIVVFIIGAIFLLINYSGKREQEDSRVDYIVFQDKELSEVIFNKQYDKITAILNDFIKQEIDENAVVARIEKLNFDENGNITFQVNLFQNKKTFIVTIDRSPTDRLILRVPEYSFRQDIPAYLDTVTGD